MQVAATMTSGAFDLNAPRLQSLYASNVANMQAWTKSQMGGRSGFCLPETMRFNGNGYWYSGNHSCDLASSPSYNALTLSSGAEVGLWMWRHYLMTQDKAFLTDELPVHARGRALPAHLRHDGEPTASCTMSPTNAHEEQWAVANSITDISAMRAFFPAVVSAAQVLGSTDSPDQPACRRTSPSCRSSRARTRRATRSTTPTSDGTQHLRLLDAADRGDPQRRERRSRAGLAVRSRQRRRRQPVRDREADLQRARLQGQPTIGRTTPSRPRGSVSRARCPRGCPANIRQVPGLCLRSRGLGTRPTCRSRTSRRWACSLTAINESVATGFDGIIRLAPALPSNWSVSGTVFVQGQSKVHVQFQNGALAFGVLEAGSTGTVRVRNPWGTTQATVVDSQGQTVVAATAETTLVDQCPARTILSNQESQRCNAERGARDRYRRDGAEEAWLADHRSLAARRGRRQSASWKVVAARPYPQ